MYCAAMSGVFQSNPKILSGEVVFKGTRVPMQNLIDYFESGYSIDEFLDDFPTVTKEQAIHGLEEAKSLLAEAVS
ncbi:MAG: DUF433 domain-containing protein [Limisphaerales bacterium]